MVNHGKPLYIYLCYNWSLTRAPLYLFWSCLVGEDRVGSIPAAAFKSGASSEEEAKEPYCGENTNRPVDIGTKDEAVR